MELTLSSVGRDGREELQRFISLAHETLQALLKELSKDVVVKPSPEDDEDDGLSAPGSPGDLSETAALMNGSIVDRVDISKSEFKIKRQQFEDSFRKLQGLIEAGEKLKAQGNSDAEVTPEDKEKLEKLREDVSKGNKVVKTLMESIADLRQHLSFLD